MSKTGMMAAVAAAAGVAENEPITITAELLKQHFPAVASQLAKEGADAERSRIAAIESASLPGHDAIVAAHKADPSKTAGDMALAIVAAEKETRKAMIAALDADEVKLKGLRSEPANGIAAATSENAGLTGEALWKSEYSVSSGLQAEFPSEADYSAFKKAEARGGIRILTKANR